MITELGETQMQIGIDSFAAAYDDASLAVSASDRLRNLVEQIEFADQVGLDVFGVGEHHRRDYLDSAPAVILGAAAARTQRICLTSAVTVLSSADPVRGVSELRHARSSFARPDGDGRRPWFIHRFVSVVRLQTRRLRLTFCREARPAPKDPRERARPLVVASLSVAQTSRPTVYLEPQQGFETYIAAAIAKKGVPVDVVTDKNKAIYILRSAPVEVKSESTGGKIARCLFAYCAGIEDKGNVSVQLIAASSTKMVWAYSVNNQRGGSKNQQSMAEAVAKHFKEFLSGAPAIAEAPASTPAPAAEVPVPAPVPAAVAPAPSSSSNPGRISAEQCSRGVCDAEQDTDHLPR
jgi:luciferase-like monooxygenase